MNPPANSPDEPVSHVSDTALWVAVHRATESKRKDALFHDAYAERLAGERGRQIVGRLDPGNGSAWSIITRTAVLDELILDAIRDGADTVLNLAAGLDTRPYRLELPASTRWIEVDFPEMIAYKESKLADARPRCVLERIALDLTDRAARQRLFARLNEESRQTLVITEGLLIYLTHDEVAALAEDLHATPHFFRWIADALTPELFEWLLKKQFKTFATGSVRMHFAPPGGVAYFERFGWRAHTVRKMTVESRRLKRQMPRAWVFRLIGSLAPKHVRERFSKFESYLFALERR
ncbi:MAG: class I SAM-dependent methyltransferase [Gammaproteobacteria bacterium]|nr:class I SAM-dependent methyltransferase [Gammaproteobacteria bacterium]